ncbi:MAG TPA: SdrD B-like domain-containing protein, partial [Urbifossiella sp.]|nr:SdrD B-like domain-containing protein [Urbifossiella sp.]
MSFADLARRTFRRAVSSSTVSARNKAKLAVTLLEDRAVPATVEGTIFYDANANEIQDSGEGFAEGIGVMLSPLGGSSMFATTDVNGHYAFTGVSPGSYGINVNSMPSGYTAEA